MTAKRWRKVTVDVPPETPAGTVDAVADLLVGLTGRGIASDEAGRPPLLSTEIALPGAPENRPVRLTGWMSFDLALEPPPGPPIDIPGTLARFGEELSAMGLLPAPLAVSVSEAEEEDWMEVFRSQHSPVRVSARLVVRPSWCPPQKGPGREIVIDPGLAFGVGNHATTRLTLYLVDQAIGAPPARPPARMLDLGTGTGILAIAAAKLGYQRVVGIDTDPLAVDAGLLNIEINHTSDVEIREGSLSETGETFDVIAANLISGVLVELATALAAHLNPGGTAILAGILIGQENDVIEAMDRAGLPLREPYHDGKWVSLVMEREASLS
jgi:ribosomal protein L11 methyltransferase